MTLLQHELTDFTVQAFQNNEFHEVTKADVLGHWSVFFFYPADFTFVCPTELEDLAAKYEDFKKIGCEIYSVSCDTHFVHKAWHDANEKIAKIQYPMLADPTALLAKDLDTYNEADGVAERYADIARTMGVVGDTTAELVEGLRAKIRSMNDAMGIPNTLKDFGIIEDEFKEKLDAIAANAVGDACTGSNPRQPSQEEMEKLLKCCYYDTEVDF